jgi:hypothetical protein
MGSKIPLICIICGAHIKYYDPKKLKSDKDIENAFGIRKLKISFGNSAKEGFLCYSCLGKIFANEIFERANHGAVIGLPTKPLSKQFRGKEG